MGKTHFAEVENANESDNNNYWSATLCGLEYTESPMTNKLEEVTCKKCLRAFPKYKKSVDRQYDDYYE